MWNICGDFMWLEQYEPRKNVEKIEMLVCVMQEGNTRINVKKKVVKVQMAKAQNANHIDFVEFRLPKKCQFYELINNRIFAKNLV